jgi:hypothetical protein
MNKKRTIKSIVMLTCALWNTGAVAGFVNGGFETGDFTGWTLANNTDINGVDMGDPHSGNYAAFFGQITADGLVSLSQSVVTTPGTSYTFSFWVTAQPYSGFDGAPDEFRASFGGTTLLDLVNVNAFNYTQYSYTVLATSASSVVRFDVANDSSFFALDDVSFAPSVVPEPTSMIPFGIGMATLAGYSVYRGKREQEPDSH